jgi:hypothetical protein
MRDRTRLGAAMCFGFVLAAAQAAAAEQVELRFDWGPETTILGERMRVRDPRAAGPTASAAPDAPAVPGATGPAAATPGGAAADGTAANPQRASAAPDPPARPPPVNGWTYRFVVRRQPDQSFEVRAIDFAFRLEDGELLAVPPQSVRQFVATVAPGLKIDAAGQFAAFLDPDQQREMLARTRAVMESSLAKQPAERQEEGRAAIEEVASLAYLEASMRQRWLELVGFWVGKKLEPGRTYSETSEQRYLPAGGGRGPVKVERRWTLLDRVPCDEAPEARGAARATRKDCVRLSLVSTFWPAHPPRMPETVGSDQVRYESSIELVTEPSTLWPRRLEQRARMLWRTAEGGEGSRAFDLSRTSWTYGPRAQVALQSTFREEPWMGTGTEPANLKPAPAWAAGTPERLVLDHRAAMERRDWPAALAFLHPELLRRAAKELRGPSGVRASDELRQVLVGADVTKEQADRMSDEALVNLAIARTSDESSRPGRTVIRTSDVNAALGHVEDREGRLHVVMQREDFRMPSDVRARSSTYVLARIGQTVGADASTCAPERDPLGCWRIWLGPDVAWEAILRARDLVEARNGAAAPALAPKPAAGD